jgi:hypothetical protein
LIVALSCLAAVLPTNGLAQDKGSQLGIVIGLTGDLMDGSRHLSLGDRVRVEDKITLALKTAPETISKLPPGALTVWFEGHRPDTYACVPGQPKECTVPNQIYLSANDPAPQKSLKDKILDSAASIFPKEPSRYFAAASRGLEGELKEAVVPLQGPQVDVAPAFADLSTETYGLRFESLGESGRKTAPTQVRWQPGKPALVSASGLKPGLYRLILLEQSGELAGSEAWLLLSAPPEYSTASATFQEVVNTVATWPASADPSAIRAVLRASLDALSRQEKGSARP